MNLFKWHAFSNKTNMKAFLIIALALILYVLTGCNPNDRNKTIGGSKDTSSVNRGGGPPVTDTATLDQVRKQRMKDSLNGDTTSRGNVDPSGREPKK